MIRWGGIGAVLVLAVGMAAGGPVAAASLSEAQALFSAGNYRAAALAATAIETPESLALASRARLVRVAYLLPRDRAAAELDEAEALARQSLDMQPSQVEAALNLAIILGYRTRLDGYVASYFAGRAEEARHLITQAESLDPASAWARLIAGAWNTEIVVAAGSELADTLYGASRDAAVKAFEAAVALDGADPAIRLEYAKALIKLYGQDGWPTAQGHLRIALAAPPVDVLGKLVQDRARQLLAALDAGAPEGVARCMKAIDPFSE
jgi:tetratricopeptide (TPR) repeat protein